MRLIVELSISISMTHWPLFTSRSGSRSTPAQVGPIVVCVCCLLFRLHCWHDEGNWSVGLVNQCQPGWADCIWWSCSDQMASWHKGLNWRGVYVYVLHACVSVCLCACVCVHRRVKWVWIAISCDCSFRNVYWNYTETHWATVGPMHKPVVQIDLWHLRMISKNMWHSVIWSCFEFSSFKV